MNNLWVVLLLSSNNQTPPKTTLWLLLMVVMLGVWVFYATRLDRTGLEAGTSLVLVLILGFALAYVIGLSGLQ